MRKREGRVSEEEGGEGRVKETRVRVGREE